MNDMIIAIDALNRDRFEDVLDAMFQLRARVFGDRLGWEIEVEDGREIDRFDALDPAYLVGLDDDGHVVSCTRLLQTTGPHMLADVFHSILDGEPPLRSSSIWEATRFCVDTHRLRATGGPRGISRATCEMVLAINDYGMRAGISDIVAVIDPVMDRVLKRSACAPYDYVGTQKQMGKVPALAALLDCTEARGAAVRAFSGIEGDVFLDDRKAIELFAQGAAAAPTSGAPSASNVVPFPSRDPARAKVTAGEVLNYCLNLVRTADGEDERRQAHQVARELLLGVGLLEEVRALASQLDAPVEATAR